MSDESVLESEEFHCKICGLIFVDPRVLQCGHTFCLQCVKNSISTNKDKSKFDCPSCKSVHKFTDKKLGPESLTKNIYLENVIAKLKANAQAAQNLPFPYNLYSSFANPTPQVYVEENGNQLPPTHDVTNAPPPQQPTQTNFYPSFSQPTQDIQNPPPSAPPSVPSAPPMDNTDISGSAPLYPNLSAPAYNQPLQVPPQNNGPPLPPKQQAPPPQPIKQVQQPPSQPVKQVQQAPPQQEKGFWSSVTSFLMGDSQPSQPKQQQPQITPYFAPFVCDPQQVYGIFKKWASSWWFAPSDFDKKFQMGQVIPAYIPFWVYSLASNCQYNAQVLTTVTEPTTKRRFETWVPANGTQTNQYQNLLICGDAEHSAVILELITSMDDWNVATATGLQPYLLPNGQATPLAKTIDHRAAWSRVTSTIIKHEENALTGKLKKDFKTDKIEQIQITNLQFSNVSGKLIFLPVFISYFIYEGKDYKFVVSGQTSELKGQRPYGLGKFGAAMKSGAELFGSVLKRVV